MELVIAEVEGLIDRLKRLKIKVDFLFCLAVLHQDHSTIKNKPIVRGLLVQLQLFFG